MFKDRQEKSKVEYNTVLKSNNGRNPLIDAFQEKLDTCLYIRQAIQDCIDCVNDSWVYSENYWIDKEPKPYEVAESPGVVIVDQIVSDLKMGVEYMYCSPNIPTWLILLYKTELGVTQFFLNYIIQLKEN